MTLGGEAAAVGWSVVWSGVVEIGRGMFPGDIAPLLLLLPPRRVMCREMDVGLFSSERAVEVEMPTMDGAREGVTTSATPGVLWFLGGNRAGGKGRGGGRETTTGRSIRGGGAEMSLPCAKSGAGQS